MSLTLLLMAKLTMRGKNTSLLIGANSNRYRGTDRSQDTLLQPEQIAETYFHLYNQHPSTWTFELELRPHTEKW